MFSEDEDAPPRKRYTTRDEAIAREIIVPIEAGGVVEDAEVEFDIEAIAEEVLHFHDAVDENGTTWLNSQGYEVMEDHDKFWSIVMRHQRKRCAACGEPVEHVSDVGWVEAKEGGHYDQCPARWDDATDTPRGHIVTP